jgi:hypothetical protein
VHVAGLRVHHVARPNQAARSKVLYASKIKETADGSRCGIGSEARQETEELTSWRIEEHGRIDERNGAAQNGEDEAQRKANARAQLEEEQQETLTRHRCIGREIISNLADKLLAEALQLLLADTGNLREVAEPRRHCARHFAE